MYADGDALDAAKLIAENNKVETSTYLVLTCIRVLLKEGYLKEPVNYYHEGKCVGKIRTDGKFDAVSFDYPDSPEIEMLLRLL